MELKFNDLGLKSDVLKSIEALGFDHPSKIQEELIPVILNGYDVIGQAQTGTGKTLAYAASILSKININTKVVRAIVLTPTRELALQVCEDFEQLNKSNRFNVLSVYGGSSIETQIRALKHGVDIVVGTPGRVMDLMRRNVLDIENLEFFVLDEADEMLNMGFLEDIESIFKNTNKNKQVLLLSATMPTQIKRLAENYMKKDYKHIKIESDTKTSTHVKEYYYLVSEKIRVEALCRIIDLKDTKRTIIFCQTKKECDELLKELSIRNYSAEVMHGDIEQGMRIKTLDRFKNDAFKILIATDVAARGIHVDNIELVINYDLPQEFEAYIHRIGRTGRAEEYGEAITLVGNRDLRFFNDLIKFTKSNPVKCEIPTKDEIISNKYAKVIEEAYKSIEDKSYEEAISYVRDYNKDELLKVAAALLKTTVTSKLGSNFNKDVTVKDEKRGNKNVKEGYTRVFLTIGKLDSLKRGTLLDFMKKETDINKDCFQNIEILNKFTFLDVESGVVDKFIKKIHNKKLNDRTIRAEIAKKSR